MWTLNFWRALLERVISTAAQAAGGALLAFVAVDGLDVRSVDWALVGSITAGAALLAAFKGLAVNAATGDGPGVTGAETPREDDGGEAPGADPDATAYIDAEAAQAWTQ